MASEVMDQRGSSSIYPTPPFFSNDIVYERQVGFWKPDPILDFAVESRNKFGAFSSIEHQPIGSANKVELNGSQNENSLFSSSLSELFKKKLKLSSNDVLCSQSIGAVASHLEENKPLKPPKEIEAHTIGDLLPDDDDLLSGIIGDLEYCTQNNSGEDIEDFDLFSSGGGLELEVDGSSNCFNGNTNLDLLGRFSYGQHIALSNPFPGEYPYIEHPSRTLFVRNINSNVEDSELRVLFEQFGDIRALYTACKHRGFVMISYCDIRAACNAMRALQNKPLRNRKLDIHFSFPKDNPSEKDINQGTLVVLNLDSSVSNDDLLHIFAPYGEIKEIRETPHKHHHRFIEFYDVRAAESALHALNRSDIAGKKIKLEPSRPGVARRCLMQHPPPEFDQEGSSGIQLGSPPYSSPSECFGSIASSGLDNNGAECLSSAMKAPISPFVETPFNGIASSLTHNLSTPIKVASLGSHNNQMGLGESNHSLGHVNFGFQSMSSVPSHSLAEYHDETVPNSAAYNSLGNMSAMSASINPRLGEGIDFGHIARVGSNGLNSNSFEINDGVFGTSGNGSCALQGHQYIWSNPSSLHLHPANSVLWQNLPSFVNGVRAHSPSQMHSLSGAASHMLNTVLPLQQHHIGSAPSVNSSLWERRNAYTGHSTDTSFHQGSLGSMGFKDTSAKHSLDLNIFQHGGGSCIDPSVSSPNVGMPSPQQRYHMFNGRNLMFPMPSALEISSERMRSRRNEANSNQVDNKKQYELDLDRILQGEDKRTTLMIKNIPNKYTSKMLLQTIDEHHRGTYDFLYLPIDFKNKCNVGYAFINLKDPMKIIPFYKSFNGKKWEKFNSEKVASLAYARIQGRAALVAHFQNSSLMNEDKRCRPILFHLDGPKAGDQEPFPMGSNIRTRPSKMRTGFNEEIHYGSPSISMGGEDETEHSSSGSTKIVE